MPTEIGFFLHRPPGRCRRVGQIRRAVRGTATDDSLAFSARAALCGLRAVGGRRYFWPLRPQRFHRLAMESAGTLAQAALAGDDYAGTTLVSTTVTCPRCLPTCAAALIVRLVDALDQRRDVRATSAPCARSPPPTARKSEGELPQLRELGLEIVLHLVHDPRSSPVVRCHVEAVFANDCHAS